MTGILKKGALMLAFAAAVGGSTYMFERHFKSPDPDAQKPATTVTVQQLHLNPNMRPDLRAAAIAGQESAEWQMRTEKFRQGFKEGKVTKEDLDEVIQYDDTQIATARWPFMAKEGLKFFDKAFKDMVTARGGTPPADMPELLHPPKEEPAPDKAKVANKEPGSQKILKALEPLIQAMLSNGYKPVGPGAVDPQLGGQTTREAIFPGGPVQNNTQISASAFKSGEKYAFSGKLTINGDLPPNVTIDVGSGKLVINGNVGAGDVIKVSQPTTMVGGHMESIGTHPEKYPCNTYGTGPSIDKPSDYGYHYGYFQNGCTKDVPNEPQLVGGHEELRYKDSEPAIRINGTVPSDAKVTSNGNVVTGRPAAKPATQPAAQPGKSS